jgi:hypothetical protein
MGIHDPMSIPTLEEYKQMYATQIDAYNAAQQAEFKTKHLETPEGERPEPPTPRELTDFMTDVTDTETYAELFLDKCGTSRSTLESPLLSSSSLFAPIRKEGTNEIRLYQLSAGLGTLLKQS